MFNTSITRSDGVGPVGAVHFAHPNRPGAGSSATSSDDAFFSFASAQVQGTEVGPRATGHVSPLGHPSVRVGGRHTLAACARLPPPPPPPPRLPPLALASLPPTTTTLPLPRFPSPLRQQQPSPSFLPETRTRPRFPVASRRRPRPVRNRRDPPESRYLPPLARQRSFLGVGSGG